MPQISPGLTAYTDLSRFDADARVSLGQDKALQQTGKQSNLNLFSRAWDCLTRSPQEIAANKATARDFVDNLRATYGDEVANMASRELSGQLNKGRPLTAYRIAVTLEKAGAMSNRIAASNDRLLHQKGSEILTAALKANFGFSDLSGSRVIDQGAILEAVDDAITQDPMFSQTKFRQDDPAFVKRYTAIARDAVDREITRQMLPHTSALVNPRPGPGGSASTQLQMYSSELGLSEDDRHTFDEVNVFLSSIKDVVVDGSAGEMTESRARIHLGQLDYLNQQLAPGSEDAHGRLVDIPGERLSEKAGAFRDALVGDMRHLGGVLEQNLGWSALESPAREALTGAHQLIGNLNFAMNDGKWDAVARSAPEDRAKIEGYLAVLKGTNPEDPTAALLVGALRQDCEKMLQQLDGLKTALDRGFDTADVAWMHKNHLEIGPTAARFTPAEVAVMKEAGMSMATALDYKNREIPIHPRTLVGELSDDRVTGEPRKLSGGALSTPYLAQYHLPDGRDKQVVFKEAISREGFGPACTDLGIDPRDSRMATRNIATRAVDELLGFGLVPETGIGMLHGKPGVVMGFAPGTTGAKERAVDVTDTEMGQQILEYASDPEMAESLADALSIQKLSIQDGRVIQLLPHMVRMDLGNPALRRDMVQLQLMDALAGQADRHAGNYVVQMSETGEYVGLRAIDNDQSFGTDIHDPNELLRREGGKAVERGGKKYGNDNFNGVLLPEIADRQMKDAFDKITPESLRAELTGLLPEAEIDAAVSRLDHIQKHLARLETEGRIIEPGEWGSQKATDALSNPLDSYVGREMRALTTMPTISYQEAVS